MSWGIVLTKTMARVSIVCGCVLLFSCGHAQHQVKKPVAIDPRPFQDAAHHWYDIGEKGKVVHALPGNPKHKTTELESIGDNILLYQKDNGGWPKNYDIQAILTPSQKDSLLAVKHILNTTFDNGTSYTHVEALATIYQATSIDKYKAAALKGIDFMLAAQYSNGGWPQYFPLEENYSKHITYNDGAMMGIVQVIRDIIGGKPVYAFVDNNRLQQLTQAYNKSIDCILNTQIAEQGKLTAWCQQHDAKTLEPVWARKFEPPSICNAESSEIVLFLMSIDNPSSKIKQAIHQSVAWFNESKILNTRVNIIKAETENTPYKVSTTDKVVVTDSQAPPIWTRYYELETHKPIFCNRDSKIVYSLAEVSRERRDGYGWYTYEPQKVLNKYSSWQQKWDPATNVLAAK